jgi:hypothetical protein
MRPDVRSWLEERAREHPTVEIPLRIAARYAASGDEEGARRCRAEAEAATRKLVAPFQRVPPDLEEEEEWYPDEEPLLLDVNDGELVGSASSSTTPTGPPDPGARGVDLARLRTELDMSGE